MQELYIDNDKALQELCNTLQGSEWLAMDTEFMREKTYYARLCLIQIATPECIACIDPLALESLDPLAQLLYDKQMTKVLHSAVQDLQIFHDLYQQVPQPVFDTQLAATLLGLGHQVSYAAMVKALLGIHLEKAHSRTDWSRRPLSEDQLHYAADDVRYLAQMYPLVLQRLTEMQRLDWLSSDFAALQDPRSYSIPEDQLWQRVSGVNKLRGRQLAVLRELTKLREQLAIKRNKPRKWIIADDALLAIAKLMPSNHDKLSLVRGLSDNFMQRHADDILACVQRGSSLPESEWPRQKRPVRLSEAEEALTDALMAVVRLKAADNHISPAMLASRKDLARLVSGERDIELLDGWRGQIVGEALLAVLRGQRILQVKEGSLSLCEVEQ